MPSDSRFSGGAIRSLRFERNLALIFALLGVLLEALIGVATFYANTRSLESLLADVRTNLLIAGGLILLFIVVAWSGVARLLRRLRESESNLSNLLEVVLFPILQLQADGSGIQRANQAAMQYLGLASDGSGRLDSLTWQALLADGLLAAADPQREVQISTPQGDLRWAMVSVSQVLLSGVAHRLISLVDVSELKATQRRLHQAANTDALTKTITAAICLRVSPRASSAPIGKAPGCQ